MKINHLTTAEENLMKLFWQMEHFYLKEVMEKHPEPKPHQNTVSTYLKILVEKEFLSIKKEGRIFKYSVAIPVEHYKSFLFQEIIDKFFEGKKEDFQEFLVSNSFIAGNIEKEKPQKKEKLSIADEILNPKKTKKKKDKKSKKKKTGN
ncbi:transcriptional regulator [Chryseobacterium sp. Leaf180]|uniref:BlaI/MecI/CopY family transcriptional regulator n=1 Tax=Chryseobacterium sp. Leaf180 TaxID=1736289 RepID=UPI0006F86075|nr:BlaI/MecI/CopY family transcriptional regulator [Chryseobacterium sp. Leaf180]KQR94720.1 transcriptional regulator [Chryseobacterium sp. Leaf180]